MCSKAKYFAEFMAQFKTSQWRSRYNKELYDLFKEPKLSITIRIARLRWRTCQKNG
jgi:hypothetical protein